ncbi:class I SAM-dependent methyltransferase [Eionea flava]
MKKDQLTVDSHVNQYISDNSLRESNVLQQLRIETAKDPAAIMQIPAEQGQLMALLVKLMDAKKTIEIGVYTGYSALCVAQALPDDSYTVACDMNEEWTAIAQKYWKAAGVNEKIDLRIAPALNTLQSLVDAGQGGTFDFVFIDADKKNYDHYYELSLQLLRSGGLIAIDNVLLFGSVIDFSLLSDALQKMLSVDDVEAIKALNKKIKLDQRVDISMLSMADGITLAYKR